MGNFTVQRIIAIPVFVYGEYMLFDDTDESIFPMQPLDEKANEQYQRINQAIIHHHLDRLVNTIRSGGTVKFIDFEVTTDGFTVDGKHLPMLEVQDVVIEDGVLKIVMMNGKAWKHFLIARFYNPIVFQALVRTILQNPTN